MSLCTGKITESPNMILDGHWSSTLPSQVGLLNNMVLSNSQKDATRPLIPWPWVYWERTKVHWFIISAFPLAVWRGRETT